MAKRTVTRTQPQEVPPTPLGDFISKYRRSTGYIYRAGLLDFFDYINGKRIRGRQATPDDLEKYEIIAVSYLGNKARKFPDDVINYAKHLTDSGIVPKTAHTRIVAVKEFFLRNGIELPKLAEKDIRRLQPKGGRRTDFEYIDRKTLSDILHHFDARGKAFTLVLASSGMRLGEALALNWSDLKCPDRKEYPDKPASVFVRDSKTGHSRTTFITRECEQALKEWKKVYPEYRDFATKRSLNLKNSDKTKRNGDDRVFPFTNTSVYAMWDQALQSAGYHNEDVQTKRLRMNIHRLRNFFSVQVASAAGQQVSEVLLGHSDKYGGAYTGRSGEQLEKDYLKAEPALTIGTTTAQTEKYATEMRELRKRNEELEARMNSAAQTGDLETMREQIRVLNDTISMIMENMVPQKAKDELNRDAAEGTEIAKPLLTQSGKKISRK
jgi:integrase